jgi:4,5-dihydroxyphthalate decarboxylase
MTTKLTIALGKHGQVEDIRSGAIGIEGVELAFRNFDRMPDAYRIMARTAEFDICELAPTTYLMARESGLPITALPLPMTRQFRHRGLQRLRNSSIRTPKQLEGRGVGLRAYSVTAPVWTRGILAEEYGVDLDRITWFKQDEEHVTSYVPPSNVAEAPPGKNLADMMRAGELEVAFAGLAGVGSGQDLDLVEFFDDADQRDEDLYGRTGIYPIHGVIVIRNDVLRANPELARNMFDAFTRARDKYWGRVTSGAAKDKEDLRYLKLAQVVGDPLPYGLEENYRSFEALIRFANHQKLIARAPAVGDAFPDPRTGSGSVLGSEE